MATTTVKRRKTNQSHMQPAVPQGQVAVPHKKVESLYFLYGTAFTCDLKPHHFECLLALLMYAGQSGYEMGNIIWMYLTPYATIEIFRPGTKLPIIKSLFERLSYMNLRELRETYEHLDCLDPTLRDIIIWLKLAPMLCDSCGAARTTLQKIHCHLCEAYIKARKEGRPWISCTDTCKYGHFHDKCALTVARRITYDPRNIQLQKK